MIAAGAGVDIDATPTYPAAYSNKNMMTVIATDQNDALAGYSNVGARLTDVAAPGSKILSTILHGQVWRGMASSCAWSMHALSAACEHALQEAACPARRIEWPKVCMANPAQVCDSCQERCAVEG